MVGLASNEDSLSMYLTICSADATTVVGWSPRRRDQLFRLVLHRRDPRAAVVVAGEEHPQGAQPVGTHLRLVLSGAGGWTRRLQLA